MKNLEDVLWKLLGEFVEVDVLPKDWKNYEEVEEIKYFCTSIKGYIRLVDNEWFIGDRPLDIDRIYRISYSKQLVNS